MIAIECPRCRLRYSVTDDLAGRQGRCRCGSVFAIAAESAREEGPAPHDVFISYSSADKDVAFAVCGVLEAGGIRCWIAPRSIVPGTDYGEAIIHGINDCRVFVLVLSRTSNASKQVKFEIERAASKGKRLLPFRVHDVPLEPSLEYFLSSSHWLDATAPPVQKHLPDLVKAVKGQLPDRRPDPAAPRPSDGETTVWQQTLAAGPLAVEVAADDDRRVSALASFVAADMLGRGFSESDGKKAALVLRELVNNVKVHVAGPDRIARVTVDYKDSYGAPSIRLRIEDRGRGFNLEQARERLWEKLRDGDREHGLLRAMRYGTTLEQYNFAGGHALVWTRKKRPTALPCLFDDAPHAVAVAFDYEEDLIRIGPDIYLGTEVMDFDRMNDAFHDLFFEPLRRSGAPLIGLEVRGMHHTLHHMGAEEFVSSLWRFRGTLDPAKRMVVLLDTEREDHAAIRLFRELCIQEEAAVAEEFVLFEDRAACARFLSQTTV